jgi:hypothetical protein
MLPVISSIGALPTPRLRLIAMLVLLPALAPSWCYGHAGTNECGCCGSFPQPVDRALGNCPDCCSCRQSGETSQCIQVRNAELRRQPNDVLSVVPVAFCRVMAFYCDPSDDSSRAICGAERCIALCRLNC